MHPVPQHILDREALRTLDGDTLSLTDLMYIMAETGSDPQALVHFTERTKHQLAALDTTGWYSNPTVDEAQVSQAAKDAVERFHAWKDAKPDHKYHPRRHAGGRKE